MKKIKIHLFVLTSLASISCSNTDEPDNFSHISDDSQISINLFAGDIQGDIDGVGSLAKFAYPESICADAFGNIYVADTQNHKIKKISPNGTVVTIAGSTSGDVDGNISVAKISSPRGLCIDGEQNLYFLSGGKVKKLSYNGIITTIATPDGGGNDMCRALNGTLYVTDAFTQKIKKIDIYGNVTTFLDESSNLDSPNGICIANDGLIYITEEYENVIKKINPESGAIMTFASGQNSNFWGLNTPHGITSDLTGNLYIANYNERDIAKVDVFGNLSQFAGKFIYIEDAIFDHPQDVVYSNDKIYVADTFNHQIKVITY